MLDRSSSMNLMTTSDAVHIDFTLFVHFVVDVIFHGQLFDIVQNCIQFLCTKRIQSIRIFRKFVPITQFTLMGIGFHQVAPFTLISNRRHPSWATPLTALTTHLVNNHSLLQRGPTGHYFAPPIVVCSYNTACILQFQFQNKAYDIFRYS